ncbi:MAG TPA: SUMF1/EgtB/PvdO family nonheme iron enzyme [Fimbriiglobus sp.]|nr:SUMF1/EgtB/PvdO family nonheme iron enzyme [Fimbriiglobus sp.]
MRHFAVLSVTAAGAVLAAVVPILPADKPTLPFDVRVATKADLPPKNFTETLPGGQVKFNMVYVPGGEFLMGSPDDEPGHRPDEGPQHRVQVRPFWLGKCEVTWDEFDRYYKDDGLFTAHDVPNTVQGRGRADAITRPSNSYVEETYDHGRKGHPVLCIMHHAAMMYCHWLRWKTKKGYRLPTEAEWEYACRAGHTGPYGFDEGEKLGDYAWFKGNSATAEHSEESDRTFTGDPTTHKVGTKKANRFGLHDLHGNVWEWCLDHYDPKFYSKFPTDAVTLGPVNKPTDRKWPHVVRGGSWADQPDRLRSAARRGSDKSWQKHDPQVPQSIWWLTKMDVIGFRVCLPAEEYPELVGLKPLVVRVPN